MSDLGDLTEFIEEAEGDATQFSYKGIKCEIPSSPTMKAMLKMQKIMDEKGENENLSDMEVLEINKLFIGEDTFDKLIDAGITIKGFEVLLTQKIMPNINLAEEDEGKNLTSSTSQKSGD